MVHAVLDVTKNRGIHVFERKALREICGPIDTTNKTFKDGGKDTTKRTDDRHRPCCERDQTKKNLEHGRATRVDIEIKWYEESRIENPAYGKRPLGTPARLCKRE